MLTKLMDDAQEQPPTQLQLVQWHTVNFEMMLQRRTTVMGVTGEDLGADDVAGGNVEGCGIGVRRELF
jgi:hypothetical protein